MKPAAYLVDLPPPATEAVFLDLARSIDYAAQHHGSVAALVRKSEADRLQAKLDAAMALLRRIPGSSEWGTMERDLTEDIEGLIKP